MNIRDKTRHVLTWVTKLALLTTSGREPVTKEKVGLYVQALMEIPEEAFNDETLKLVSTGSEYFPAFAIVRTALTTWAEEHKPKPLALPLPDNLREQIDELRDNTNWRDKIEREAAVAKMDWMDPNKVRESAAKLDGHKMRMVLGRMLARMVRKHAPENLGHLPPEFLMQTEERAR